MDERIQRVKEENKKLYNSGKIQARLEQGRWLADCPKCNGAELVYPGESFVCGNVECEIGNYEIFKLQGQIRRAKAAGKRMLFDDVLGVPMAQAEKVLSEKMKQAKLLTVIFPADKSKIDIVTVKRPYPENRNWYPWESLKDLQKENALHGIKD